MKNRIVETLLIFAFVASVMGGANTITANAADYVGKFDAKAAQMISQVFDAEYYAKTYPDVAAAFGTKKAALLNHYLTCGIFEGRDASATFNADAYAAANADLVVVYDTDNNVADYTNYFFHYINCGQKEGRIATVADATAAGFTVSSVADNTKTIAAPTKATKTYASSGSSSSGGSSSTGYASSSSNSGSAATTNTATTSDSSASATESSNTIVYNDDSGYVHDWDTDSGQAIYDIAPSDYDALIGESE